VKIYAISGYKKGRALTQKMMGRTEAVPSVKFYATFFLTIVEHKN